MENQTIDTLPGLDKSAILFQILGESLALSMFQGLSESDILKIRVRSKELKNVPFDIKQAILEEFYFKMMTQKYRETNKSKKLFSFLDELNDEQIYYLINTESTKVIALALDQLSEARNFNILNRFPNNMKHNIIIEFAELKDIPLEGVVNIANELKKKITFIPGPKEFNRGGAKSIATLLNQMSIEESEQYLHQIEQDDPELYADVKTFFLTFDDITVNHIISFMPSRKQKMYTPVSTPLSKKDVETAQLSIVQLAKDLGQSGELNLDDILANNEMID